MAIVLPSTISVGSFSVGIAEESDEPSVPEDSTGVADIARIEMTPSEVNDMSFVSDFIDSNEEYSVQHSVAEFIRESVRSKRATSDISKEVLGVIRHMRASPGERSVENALGYEDSIIDMPSKIMQWVLNNQI